MLSLTLLGDRHLQILSPLKNAAQDKAAKALAKGDKKKRKKRTESYAIYIYKVV